MREHISANLSEWFEMPSARLESLSEVNWKECLFGKRMRKWAFWFVIAFLSALTVKDVIDLIMEYGENPKKSDMNMMFNESMTMPNITFCMSKTQAMSHFRFNASEPEEEWDLIVQEELRNMSDHDRFLKAEWNWRLVMEAYDVVAALNSIERETTAQGAARSITVFRTEARVEAKRRMVKKWLDAIAVRGVSFEEFTQKVGTETMRRSMQRFQRTSFNEDLVISTRLRTSWISEMQFCFQPWFDLDNFYDIEDQGTFFTLMLSHDVDELAGKEVECMSVDFHGRPSSLSRFMQGKGRSKDGFNDDLCPGKRHEVTVEVRARYEMLENDDNGTACRDGDQQGESEFDCRSICRMQLIQSMCGCTALTLSYLVTDEDTLQRFPLCDYQQCKLDVQRGRFSDEECSRKCYRDCVQVRFEVDHETQGKMVRSDLTLVNLKWGSFEYLTLKQDWVWSVASFIAALGGSIGMWLGLSILSLIQGSTYLYLYLTREVIKKRRILTMTPEDKRKNSKSGRKFSVNPLASPFGSVKGRQNRSQSADGVVVDKTTV